MIVIPISALVLQRECKMAHFFTKTYLVVLTKMLIPLAQPVVVLNSLVHELAASNNEVIKSVILRINNIGNWPAFVGQLQEVQANSRGRLSSSFI